MNVSERAARTGHGPRRVAPIIVGALAGLLALGLLAGGGALVWAHGTKRDAEGFYATGSKSLATPTYALASEGLDVGTGGPGWLFRHGRLGTIRVAATSTSAHPVFVGIGPKAKVAAYLASVAHDAVTDVEVDPFSVTYARRPGSAAPAAPGDETLWVASASGSGRQTISWPVKQGDWAVVVMNADASPGVRTDVSVGAKVPFVLWLGIGLLGIGGLIALGGAAAIFFGTRTRRRPELPASA